MTGLGIARDASALYFTSVILVLLAAVPTVVRVTQVIASNGSPEGSVVSEAFVGIFRVTLAVAILLVTEGWQPFSGELRPPGLSNIGAEWSDGVDFGAMIIDLVVYALIYGVANLAISGLLSDRLIGS